MNVHDQSDLLLRTLKAPQRNRFFYGKRMDVEQFQMEQDYGKRKQWLLNRLTLGKGVLCGLAASVDGDRVCIEPGVAIDGLGREIVVHERACIDPAAEPAGCCEGRAETTGPGAATAEREEDVQRLGTIFTVWLCYHECLADPQPVLVTDCDTHRNCAHGTVVESYCLKVTHGRPPLQQDPRWCLDWARGGDDNDDDSQPPPELPTDLSHDPTHGLATSGSAISSIREHFAHRAEVEAGADAGRAGRRSRRRDLCELLDGNCDPDEGDPCVPLAIGVLREGRIVRLESCLVRPRVYSNAVLLDLILCLAARVDHCCKAQEEPPAKPLLRVESVTFVSRDSGGGETSVAVVASPLDSIKVPISKNPNAIRVRFTDSFAQDAHVPTTHALNEPDYKRHNVQVLAADPVGGLDYVPGTLTIEDARTIRFDHYPKSPYATHQSNALGWKKGRYRLALYGDDDPGTQRLAIADGTGRGLDGEPILPGAGAISGNGTPGGIFALSFVIG